MNIRITVAATALMLLFVSCGKDSSEDSSGPGYLSGKAESIVSQLSEYSEESALKYLKEFASTVDKRLLIPGEGLTVVKYHTGISHSAEGLFVNGSLGGDLTVPPEKSYYHEFHYDSEGKLSHMVENNKGVRALSNLFYYDGNNPVARLCFVQGKYSYSDLAAYNEDGMYFKCRIDPEGKVLSKVLLQ